MDLPPDETSAVVDKSKKVSQTPATKIVSISELLAIDQTDLNLGMETPTDSAQYDNLHDLR